MAETAAHLVERVIATFVIKQSGLNRSEADTGAVTLIQRFGSAANLYGRGSEDDRSAVITVETA